MHGVNMKIQNLNKSRIYEKEQMNTIKEETRPIFHFSAPVGWLNDPNGFSMYKGEYHLFYQYHPFSVHWGPMHWGHTKTKDFIKWSHIPIALAPDHDYDQAGCFSGTAIELNGKHILAYTSVMEEELENGKRKVYQQQSIAVGNGVDYEKLSCNPVLTEDMLPEGVSKADFRDPKLWFADGTYNMLVANRSDDGSGQLLLFRAIELDRWEFVSVFDKCNNEYGKMWECPDYFTIDDKEIIIISPQDMRAKGNIFHCGNGTIYFVGRTENEQFVRDQVNVIDYGLDFYAPQTLLTKDNRRIMIAWMQSWDTYLSKEENGWSGMMTLPREIMYCEEKQCIIQKPVKEIESYWSDTVSYDHVTINSETKLEGIEGRVVDINMHIKVENQGNFVIKLAHNDEFHVSITYNSKNNTLEFSRMLSDLRRDIVTNRVMNVDAENEELNLRILLDKYSIEIFADDGKNVMTNVFNVPIEAEGITFQCDTKASITLKKHRIEVI